MNAVDITPPVSPMRAACEGRRTSDVFRWATVALLAGVIFVPYLFAPSLVRVEGSMIRAGIMLAEASIVLAWSTTRHTAFLPQRLGRGVWCLGACWFIALLVATGTAEHIAPALLRTAEWAAHGLFAFMLWSEFQRDRRTLDAVVRAIPIGFAGFVGVVSLFAVLHPDPYHYNWLKDVPFLGHVRRFGMYALAGFAFSACAFLSPYASRWALRWSWGGLMLSWAVLLWSGGRGAIGAALVVVAYLWWSARDRRGILTRAFVTASVVGTLLSLCFPVASGALGIGRFFAIAREVGGIEEFATGRLNLWRTAWAAWMQRPWIGLGPDATAFVLAPFGHVQPHNFILQFMVEWGIGGTTAFLLLTGGGIIAAMSRVRCERDGALAAARAVATAYVLGMAALGLLDGSFYHARPLLLVATATAVAMLPSEGSRVTRIKLGRSGRLAIRGGAIGIILLVVAHTLTVRAVWEPSVPAPDSARAAFVNAFPSTGSLRETVVWAQAWAEHDPEVALTWARWGQRHAVLPWYYMRFEADMLLVQGKTSEAKALYAAASRLEEAATRPRPGWQ